MKNTIWNPIIDTIKAILMGSCGAFAAFITTALIIFIMIGISFGCVAGIVYVICWAFNFTFTWKLAVGIYAAMILIGELTKINIYIDKFKYNLIIILI